MGWILLQNYPPAPPKVRTHLDSAQRDPPVFFIFTLKRSTTPNHDAGIHHYSLPSCAFHPSSFMQRCVGARRTFWPSLGSWWCLVSFPPTVGLRAPTQLCKFWWWVWWCYTAVPSPIILFYLGQIRRNHSQVNPGSVHFLGLLLASLQKEKQVLARPDSGKDCIPLERVLKKKTPKKLYSRQLILPVNILQPL